VNKSTLSSEGLTRITWGAAQLGIGQGVLDAVAEGLMDAAEAHDIVLLVALWVDPAAHDETAVRLANREAMRGAIASAVGEASVESVRAMVERRDEAANAFYAGD
jgi:5,6,7,8-tetrahydromethanopterin hydro-lyase